MEQLNEAVELAKQAVNFDQRNCTDAAIYYYREAARVIFSVSQMAQSAEFQPWIDKAKEYMDRAETLRTPRTSSSFESHKPEVLMLRKCNFLFKHALDADEAGQKDVALELYKKAIALCLQAKDETTDPEQKKKLGILARNALDRAEELRGVSNHSIPESGSSQGEIRQNAKPIHNPTLSRQVSVTRSEKPPLDRGWSSHLVVCGSSSLGMDEIKVLQATSKINGIDYVPFMNIDLSEKFQFAMPFTDRDGPLVLSAKQKKEFSHWARPEEICREPKMIQNESTDCYSIKQTIVTDCSFVASLAVSALFEKKFNQSLITSIIYPRNKQKKPIYNPFGKYMVKLHLNGVKRKVIIDDTLPVGRHGELLCSFSTNKNELWISLLEKAYMKVMGGYDFPGSNSNIDLHVLTGWIPERVAIKQNDPSFNSEECFNKLFVSLDKGEVLVTVATGNIPESEAERAGLVPTHAYAVLDIRKIKNIKLLKLKNPWSHVRWKGNFSEVDRVHWTPDLQAALNFDPKSAEMFDNGVFWIDYTSILNFFDVFYLNWNPKLFSYTSCIHQSWSAGVGPAKDNYNIGENPQFTLTLDPPRQDGADRKVWILLTRHITTIEDFKNNSEYITVLVYKNDGRRVYYPMDPPPYLDGIRINSPHYLTKIVLGPSDRSLKKFTLVISQYEKSTTIYYTLRVYSTCPFALNKITDPYIFTYEVKDGRWDDETAGGCPNHPATYPKNPKYQIVLEKQSQLLIDLKGPKVYNIGVEISTTTVPNFKPISSAPYRSGFVVLDTHLPAGTYHVVPSTFYPNQKSAFFLKFKCSNIISVTRIN